MRMNYKHELDRLNRLRSADFNAYLNELDKPWSGMEDDLDLAVKIMLKHAAASNGQLSLLENCHIPEDPSKEATITLPQWWFEIIITLKDLYEPPEAEYRTQKVLNELIGKQVGRGALATYH
jgi:hypothetical protein